MTKKRKRLFIIIPLCLAVACAAALAIYYAIDGYGGMLTLFARVDRTDMMQAQEYRDSGAALPYRIYVPESYGAAEKYPLVLYLHGAGQRGGDNRAQTRKNSVMQTLLSKENREKYPCIVLAPQCPEEQWWEAEPLMGLLEHAKAAYPVDSTRIYVTGLSMGGYGAWNMLAAYPGFFAAAVPICGGWEPEDAALMADVPIWAFHGAMDTIVPPEGSRGMVKALEDAGGNVKYTEYPRERHRSWERAYREPGLFPWMFAQVRG